MRWTYKIKKVSQYITRDKQAVEYLTWVGNTLKYLKRQAVINTSLGWKCSKYIYVTKTDNQNKILLGMTYCSLQQSIT